MTRSTPVRLLIILAALCALSGLTPPASAASTQGSVRTYAVSKGNPQNPDEWWAVSAGTVRFYSSQRRFDINGRTTYHRPPATDVAGVVFFRQNLQNTTSDPRWQQATGEECAPPRLLRAPRDVPVRHVSLHEPDHRPDPQTRRDLDPGMQMDAPQMRPQPIHRQPLHLSSSPIRTKAEPYPASTVHRHVLLM